MTPTSRILRCTLIASLGCGACATEGEIVELGIYHHDAATPKPSDGGAHTPAPDSSGTAELMGPPPCAGYGCILDGGLDPEVADLHCEQLTAHAIDDTSRPYPVPTTPDHYVRFTFKLPHTGTEYVRSIQPTISEAIALHHMTLYESQGEVVEGVETGVSRPAALSLVYGWAPGTPSLFLDRSVGLEVKPNTFYTVELHLNLVEPRTVNDSSGFYICFTPTKPSYELSISRLGVDPTFGTSATSTCTPTNRTPITLLTAQPQLSLHGRHASLTVMRVSGEQELIYDHPVDFTSPTLSRLGSRPIAPGDTLTTRCDYATPSRGGPGVDEATCAMYVLHWPAHSLVNGTNADRCAD